jgi:hypothetical protein
MKIGIQVNENLQVVNYCSEEHYNAELEEIRVRDYPLGLIEIGEQNPEDLLLQYYVDGVFYEKSLDEKRAERLAALEDDFNASKKTTIQNGETLIVEHDTPERDIFLKLIEDVSNLSTTEGAAFIYEQQTATGKLALRILPEIATYIFKDLFVSTLNNPQQTKVNARVHNKTTVYELALENINNATTQTELDSISWTFLNPTGIIIDVNNKANEMLADPTVSDFAKAAINAAKDPVTGEIHLVKTLPELAADS